MIEAVEDTDCPNVLTDTRDHPPLSREDQEWSAQTWGPDAEAAGGKHTATLAPESVVSKISIENVTDQADSFDDIERGWFEEYEDAVSWLTGS